ncbi:Syntaxin-22 [Asimina triloba]
MSPFLLPGRHKTRLHIGQLVKDTTAKLKQATEVDHHSEVSTNKKIADAKLAKDFQAVLKEFQKAQRLAAERETAYSTFVPTRHTANGVDTQSYKIPEERALLVESRRQEVVLLDNEIVFNEAIIEEREQGIQEIHQQIGEVNEMFKDLAVLVHDQGYMIDDIGSNVESSHAATSQAKSQLTKAAKTQRSNSSLGPMPLRWCDRHLICISLSILSWCLVHSVTVSYHRHAGLLALVDIWDHLAHRDNCAGGMIQNLGAFRPSYHWRNVSPFSCGVH